jgi:hypothetical protein
MLTCLGSSTILPFIWHICTAYPRSFKRRLVLLISHYDVVSFAACPVFALQAYLYFRVSERLPRSRHILIRSRPAR